MRGSSVDERRRQARLRTPAPGAERSAPPPTWTTSRSRAGRPPRRAGRASSQPSVAPPSMARPLRLPWHGEGHGAVGDGSEQPQVGGIARPRPAGARRPSTSRAEVAQAVEDGRRRRSAARRRGVAGAAARATTAAASAALPQLAMARGAAGSASPRASATRSASRTPKRWRALCEPETLPVSSLTQRPPGAAKPRRASQARRADERRDPEAVHRRHAATASSSSRTRPRSGRRSSPRPRATW